MGTDTAGKSLDESRAAMMRALEASARAASVMEIISRQLRALPHESPLSAAIRLTDRVAAVEKALARLLWDSIADDAACICEPADMCPQCQAMKALGLGSWPPSKEAMAALESMR